MLMQKFSKLPLTLYVMQSAAIPKLRDRKYQIRKGRIAFNFIPGQSKLYNPIK